MECLLELQGWSLSRMRGLTDGSEGIPGGSPSERENKGMVELKGDGGRGDNGGRS